MGKDDAAFQEEFEAVLKAAGDGIADFTQFVFPRVNYGEKEFKAECVFRGATFSQNADFLRATFTQNAHFDGAAFTRGGHFSYATFTQDANFHGATFTQDVSFYGATFTQGGDFSDATFTQDANFGGATFTQDVGFYGATFAQDAHFIRATFTRNAHFIKATFTWNAYFNGATFTQSAYFGSGVFTQVADFRGTKFLGAAEFRDTKFRGHDKDRKERPQDFLPGPVFSLAEFSQPEKIVFYKTYLGQALFHNCDVSKVTFSSVEWREREGKRMVFEEEVDLTSPFAEALRPAAGNPDERNYGLIAELYQQLKKNYDERKDYWTAGDFHYGELEMKRLASRRKNKILRWLVQHLRLVAWYKYASQYGESYVRPAFWFVATLLFFALLYPSVGLHDSTKETAGITAARDPVVNLAYTKKLKEEPAADFYKSQLTVFAKSFLTAVEIAAFQKEPIYKPVGARGRVLTLVETLLTSTLAALFFLAVRRQFRR